MEDLTTAATPLSLDASRQRPQNDVVKLKLRLTRKKFPQDNPHNKEKHSIL